MLRDGPLVFRAPHILPNLCPEEQMLGEIIAIGDELTSGRIVNTTSGFAAKQLFAAGHEIFAMHTIGDTPRLIGEALRRAIGRVDFVIVTGGLGPTSDDLTTEAVARALDRPPTLNREVLEQIERQLQDTDQSQVQLEKLAWLPEGAQPLNTDGCMAGYMLIHDSTPIFFLPGVPSQMKELLVNFVLPRLATWPKNNRNHVRQRLYRTFGLSEREVNDRLLHLEEDRYVKLGYYPVDSEVHVSLTVLAPSDSRSEQLFKQRSREIEQALGTYIYGRDHDTMASVVGDLLMADNLVLGVAESCTGGLIGSLVTEVPGSSRWFSGGVIAYSNALKKDFLHVDQELLTSYGAVSEQVARAMASRLAARTGCDVALSVTGIAGPGGGSPEKPVGTVYIGLHHRNRVRATLHRFSGSRREIRNLTAMTALDSVRRALLHSG